MTAPTEYTIPARSRRQALDWSLVLVSQGIESVILAPSEDHGWHLRVDAADYPRARQAIRQYRAENRGHRWLQKVPGTRLVFDWSSLVWAGVLGAIFGINLVQAGHLRAVGIMDSQDVRAGEWWRLFTAIMLHADLGHLAANLTTGLVLLGLAMGTLGPGLGVLGAYLAGVGGNVAGLLFHPEIHRGLGASGMVLGALGMLTAQSFVFRRAGPTSPQLILRGLLGGLLLLVLLGFSPNPQTDIIAHVGGFVAGIGLGTLLVFLPASFTRSAWVNRSALALVTALVLVTWGLALASVVSRK